MSIERSSAPCAAQVPGELVSALMDGQLRGPLLGQTARAAAQDAEALTRWRDYHLIGEALRAPAAQQTVALSSPAFFARLEQRLADEGVLQTRWPESWAVAGSMRPPATAAVKKPAIAEPHAPQALARSRAILKARPSHAAMAAMVGMVVVAAATLMPASELPRWAQTAPMAPQQVAVQALAHQPLTPLEHLKAAPTLRDPRLQEFLAAHQQAAGNSALSVPAGHFLNATFEMRADAPR